MQYRGRRAAKYDTSPRSKIDQPPDPPSRGVPSADAGVPCREHNIATAVTSATPLRQTPNPRATAAGDGTRGRAVAAGGLSSPFSLLPRAPPRTSVERRGAPRRPTALTSSRVRRPPTRSAPPEVRNSPHKSVGPNPKVPKSRLFRSCSLS